MAAVVIYYSRAGENYFGGQYRYVDKGNTEIVAEKIAAATGAALFKIEQAVPYSDDYQTCVQQAREDLKKQVRPELAAYPKDMAVDEIYLGYPNYWGDLPMAVYTFLERYNWQGKTIHPFCTHEGSGLGNTVGHIGQACPGAAVTEGLAVLGSQAAQSDGAVSAWLNR